MLYRRASTVLWRRTASAVVAATLEGDTTVLRGTGPAIWEELAVASSIDDICRRLADRYGAGIDDIRSDVVEALAALTELGLIEHGRR